MLDKRCDEELVVLDAVGLVLEQGADLVAHADGCHGLGSRTGLLWDLLVAAAATAATTTTSTAAAATTAEATTTQYQQQQRQ